MSLLLALTATGGGQTLTCNVGDAAAQAATASLLVALSAATGEASATGVTARQNTTVNAGPGSALAVGVTCVASASTPVVLACTVGSAEAGGVGALQNIGIQGNVGESDATGTAAQLNRIFGTVVGEAIAQGVVAVTYSGNVFVPGAQVLQRPAHSVRPSQLGGARQARVASTTR